MSRELEEPTMRLERGLTTVICVLFLAALPASAGGDVNLLIGTAEFKEDLFKEAGVESQFMIGVAVTADLDWPVALAFDLLSSSDDNVVHVPAANPTAFETNVDTLEVDVGVRKVFDEHKVKPYVGGGLAWVQLDAEQIFFGSLGPGSEFQDTIVDDSDSSLGYWVDGGVLWRIGDQVNIGLDVRFTKADASLTSVDGSTLKLDSGGARFALAVGYHW
jgi:opacity protein-like surface antigen